MDSYTVTRRKHGIIVEGPVPLLDTAALLEQWVRDGYTQIALDIAAHYGATLVVTSETEGDAWRKELGL